MPGLPGRLLVILGLLALTGCGQKAAPAASATCRPPVLTITQGGAPDDAAHDALFNCVRDEAYQGVLGGGPVEVAAAEAVGRCAGEESAYLRALGATRRVWPYDRAVLHDEIVRVARATATQKRSRGCGRPGGEPENLMTTGER